MVASARGFPGGWRRRATKSSSPAAAAPGRLPALEADLVIDAAGPFQGSSYAVPEACIAARIPYLDLADGRDFVCGIGALDQAARAAGVAIVAGASSVCALSGAVV